jgi:hypothetical protein
VELGLLHICCDVRYLVKQKWQFICHDLRVALLQAESAEVIAQAVLASGVCRYWRQFVALAEIGSAMDLR